METTKEDYGFWNKVFGYEIEYARFAVISASLVLVGCLGGITVGLGAINSVPQLIMILFPTMAALSACLAVMPMKWIMNLSIMALLIDLIIIAYNLIA
jgi:hypothetical protein